MYKVLWLMVLFCASKFIMLIWKETGRFEKYTQDITKKSSLQKMFLPKTKRFSHFFNVFFNNVFCTGGTITLPALPQIDVW